MTTLEEAQKKIGELEAEVKELDDECAVLHRKLARREKTLETSKIQLNQSSVKIKELEQCVKDLETKLKKFAHLETGKQKLEQQLEQLQIVSKVQNSDECPETDAQAQISKLEDELAKRDEKIARYKKTIEEREEGLAKLDDKDRQIVSLTSELKNFKSGNNQQEASSESSELIEKNLKLEKQTQDLSMQVSKLEQKLKSAAVAKPQDEQISVLEAKLGEKDEKLAKYKKEFETMNKELALLDAKDDKIDDLTSKMKTMQKEIQLLKSNGASSVDQNIPKDDLGKNEEHKKEKDRLLAKLHELEIELNTSKSQLLLQQNETKEFEADVSKLEKELSKRNKKLEKYKKEIDLLNQELDAMEANEQEIGNLTFEISKLKKELEQHSNNQEDVSCENLLKNEEMMQINAQLESHNEELSSQIQQLQKDLKSSRLLADDREQEVYILKDEISRLEVESSLKNNQIEKYEKERAAMIDDLAELDRKKDEIVKLELQLKSSTKEVEDSGGEKDGTDVSDKRYEELLRQNSALKSTNEELASEIQSIIEEKEEIENERFQTQAALEAHISDLESELLRKDDESESESMENKLKTKDFEIEKLLKQVSIFEKEIDSYRASGSSDDYLLRKQKELSLVNSQLEATNLELLTQVEKLKMAKNEVGDKGKQGKQKDFETEMSQLDSEILTLQNEQLGELVLDERESLLENKNQEIETLKLELNVLKKENEILLSNENNSEGSGQTLEGLAKSNTNLSSVNETLKLAQEENEVPSFESENISIEASILDMQKDLEEERKRNRELIENETYKNELIEMKDAKIQSLESRIQLMMQKMEALGTSENNSEQSDLDDVTKRSSQLEFKNEELLAEIHMLKIDLDMARRKMLTEDQNDARLKISELEAEIVKRDKDLEAVKDKDSLKDLLMLLESKDEELIQLKFEVNELKQGKQKVGGYEATGLTDIPEDGNREQLVGEINYLSQQLQEAAGAVEMYEKQMREMKAEMEELKNREREVKTDLFPQVEEIFLQSGNNHDLESFPGTNFLLDGENSMVIEETANIKQQTAQLQSQSWPAESSRPNFSIISVSDENDELKSRVAMLAAANEGLKHELKMMRENDDIAPVTSSSYANSANGSGVLNQASLVTDLHTLQTELSKAETTIDQLTQQISDLQKDLSLKQSEIQALTTDRNSKMSHTNENIGLKIEVQHLKNELSAQQSVNEKLESDLGTSHRFSTSSLTPLPAGMPWIKIPENAAHNEKPKILSKNRREDKIVDAKNSYIPVSSPASFDDSVQRLLATISKKPPTPASYNSPPKSVTSSSSSRTPLPSGGTCRSQTFSHRIATSPLQELGRPKEISSLKTREDIPREYNKQIDEFSRSTHALLQSMSNLEARLQRKDSQMRNLSTTLINGSS